jgi:hypothetical protein
MLRICARAIASGSRAARNAQRAFILASFNQRTTRALCLLVVHCTRGCWWLLLQWLYAREVWVCGGIADIF